MNNHIEDIIKYRRGRDAAREDNRTDGVERSKQFSPGSDEVKGYRDEWDQIRIDIELSSRAY